jgi:hypothetical protein
VSISEAAEPCLELDSEQEASGSWEEDWDRTVPGEIDPDQPCFILYHLDEKDSSPGHLTMQTPGTIRMTHGLEQITIMFQAEDALCSH